MGRFKRSKGKKRVEIIFPENWKSLILDTRSVLKELQQAGQIKSYRKQSLNFKEKVMTFIVTFHFCDESAFFHFFLSTRDDECTFIKREGSTFDCLVGKNINKEEIKKSFEGSIKKTESGFILEQYLVEQLTSYYERAGSQIKVTRSTRDDDINKKFDLIVFGFEKPFGLQVKMNVADWIKHRNSYPKVPSILVNQKVSTEEVSNAIDLIALSLKRDYTEHINLLLKKAPA